MTKSVESGEQASRCADRAEQAPLTTREKLLRVSAEQFAEKGFRQTSVSAVARGLDITPSAVYFHFAGKEELFLAAFDHEVGRLGDAVIGAGPDAPGEGYWLGILDRVLDTLPEFPLVQRVFRGQESELTGRVVSGEISQRLRAAVSISLRKGQEVGRVRTDIDRERVAAGIEAMMLDFLFVAVQSGDTERAARATALGDLITLALQRQ
ncbi:TetR/AcrR family transcriptional regulator [Gordonia sp. CPCC 206044]|uniref:TetR/AcrR family transcriptional regulator n=1 Tax=Gordonia sp. CPCC 206044 TaxID=3140793 RepID=UPI003AF3B006